MTEEVYKRLQKEYKASKQPPSEEYLCKVPGTGEVIFGKAMNDPMFGIYTKEQNGYKRALEITSVPLPETCEKCGQVIGEIDVYL